MSLSNRTQIDFLRYMLWMAFLIFSAVLIRGVMTLPKCLDFDSQRGVLAARQFETSRSPSLVRLVVADPDNIDHVITKPECWRAPGYQAIPYAIRSLGVNWGQSLQVTICFFVTCGVLSWMACYRNCIDSPWTTPALGCVLVLSPVIVESIRIYDSGDLLLFGATPVAILVNMRAYSCGRRSGIALSVLGGLLSVSLFLLKYSGIFAGFGIGFAWLIHSIFNKNVRTLFAFWLVGCLTGVAIIFSLGYPWGPSPSSSLGTLFRTGEALMALGTWPAAMTDTAQVLHRIGKGFGITELWMRHFGTPLVGLLFILSAICLAGTLLRQSFTEWFRGLRTSDASPWWPYTILGCIFLFDLTCYSLMIFFGGGVEVTSRLARISALAAFPLVLSLTLKMRDFSRPNFLTISLLTSLLILSGPALGALRLIHSLAQPADSGANQTLGPLRVEGVGKSFSEQQAVIDELLQYVGDSHRVLLVPEPGFMYFQPNNPFLLVYIDSMSATELDSLCFRGIPKSGVVLILPSGLPKLSKQVQTAFRDVTNWNIRPLSSDDRWEVWMSQ